MGKRILLVDDDALILRSLSSLLEKEGYEVVQANNGAAAIQLAREIVFDLVITDIRMPGMNGLEAIKQIYQKAERDGATKVPAIFITGYSEPKIEEEAKQVRPIAYIYKPFEVSELMDKVREVLNHEQAAKV